MITTNVFQRVFQIHLGKNLATCFTIDIDNKQYLVTAHHFLENWDGKEQFQIFHDGKFKKLSLQLLGHCDGEIDISVLVAPLQLSPTSELEADPGGIMWGQDVYFLGFPYGLYGEIGELNRNFPLPFVKKAILSCVQMEDTFPRILFLDGHNNPGFSGGPVVFKEHGKQDYKVASIISGFLPMEEPIYAGQDKVHLSFRYNTGIIVSYGINHAVDLIRNHPIGVELPPSVT